MRLFATGCVVLTALICTPLAASAEANGKKIANLVPPLQQPFIASYSGSMVERAKALGLEVTVFASSYNPAVQAQQVDDAIARKFDMIVITAGSQNAIVPALKRAKDAGIPVLLAITPPKAGLEDLFVSYVGADNPLIGKIAADATAKALQDSGRSSGKVALVTGVLEEGIAPIRVKAFTEELRSHAGIEVVATEDAKWDTALSEKIAGQLYARFSGKGGLDAIYAMSDNMADAAIKAAQSAGLHTGTGKDDILIISSNCEAPGIRNIKAGKQYSDISFPPKQLEIDTANLVADYFNGKTLQKANYEHHELITKQNVDQWAGACEY